MSSPGPGRRTPPSRESEHLETGGLCPRPCVGDVRAVTALAPHVGGATSKSS